jgi:hypothetical protein
MLAAIGTEIIFRFAAAPHHYAMKMSSLVEKEIRMN